MNSIKLISIFYPLFIIIIFIYVYYYYYYCLLLKGYATVHIFKQKEQLKKIQIVWIQ